ISRSVRSDRYASRPRSMGGDPHSILSSAASRPHTVIGRTQPVKARVDDIRLVPAARSEERCPRLEIQSWRSGKAGGPEYRRLRSRRRLGMTSAADIAALGGTIQRAHELLVPIAVDHQLDECGRTSSRAQAFYLCCASSDASLRDLAVLFSILR